jgi:hypothetical protein
MKGLGREARALLDSARHADSAPLAIRQRAHKHFVNAVAAGTVSASAAVAKATSIGALNLAAPGGMSMVASSSLTATVVSAVVAGVSVGVIALTPVNKTSDASSLVTAIQSMAPPSIKAGNQDRQTPRREREISGLAAADTSVPTASARPTPPTAHLQNLPDDTVRARNTGATSNVSSEQAPARPSAPLDSTAAFDETPTTPPSKVSIARETELLAEVQRALQQGHAASALTLLKRYATEFPSGRLEEEAIASRVVALCQFGRHDDAARWRAEFFRRYPNSPLGGRVRNACQATIGAGPSAPERN